ncbi:MAG: hypothetical protein J1E38_02980 [Paramuribaculum sp.]|nr:hypothetical protein [Paramuribaculum sp.]
MKKAISFICIFIVMIACASSLDAQTGRGSSSGATLDASMLIVKKGQYVQFSSNCQANLKRAGFTLSYTRNVQLHSVDNDYNDILVTNVEKTYKKGSLLVKLYFNSMRDSEPNTIEIDFPTQSSRNSFFSTLKKLGFTRNGDSYIALYSGMFVEAEGNRVSIAFTL